MKKFLSANMPSIQKFLPAVALFILTAALMLFFKNRDVDNIYRDGKKSLMDFYTSNLKPLLLETTLSNEDVFNFAMYQKLPLDKNQNKNLVLSNLSQGNGDETFYSVQPAGDMIEKHNYENFISSLHLNEDGRAKIDSILESYKEPIYESIYSSDSTIAVSPRLKSVRDALFADLMLAVKESNHEMWLAMAGETHFLNDFENVYDFTSLAKNQPLEDFIVFAPDTVFATKLKVNVDLVKDLNKNLTFSQEESKESNYITYENNQSRQGATVNLRKIRIPDMPEAPTWNFNTQVMASNNFPESPQFDALMKNIDSLTERIYTFNFAFALQDDAESLKIEFNTDNLDSLENLNLNFNLGSLNKLISESVEKSLNNMKWNEWEELGVKFDSLGLLIEEEASRYDSLMRFEEQMFRLNIDSLKEAIKQQKKKK
ncbi:MAG: hypothetical protein PHW27_00850 [Melioribacteraceae bacterium]|nr:hypothetical protein [Melioribacteraceae bacterium]MDD3557095.1 hypothetical protein [Melioribacteraceae bacterium]